VETLNRSYIDELRALQKTASPNFLRDLIDLFLKETASQLVELRGSLERKDAARLQGIAHKLKGSTGNLGAEKLSSICARLQQLAPAGDWPGSEALVGGIEQEFAAVKAGLEAEKSR
jgi:HPt (histidine-containing phosphotransfer) domain-containing protein